MQKTRAKINISDDGSLMWYYFWGSSRDNSSELATLMLGHSLDYRLPDELVERKIEENKRFYSESLINFAKKIVQDFQTAK